MAGLVVHKAEQRADPQRGVSSVFTGSGSSATAVTSPLMNRLSCFCSSLPAKVQRPLVGWRALDEHEVRVGELDGAGRQR